MRAGKPGADGIPDGWDLPTPQRLDMDTPDLGGEPVRCTT